MPAVPQSSTGVWTSHTYDAMNRLNGMTEVWWGNGPGAWTQSSPVNIISSSAYNAAGQLASLNSDVGCDKSKW